MNKITNSAAILVRDNGSKISQKNCIGVAPSIRALSNISSDTVRKTCRNINVAVAEAIRFDGDPDPTSAGTAGDAGRWVGSSAVVGMAANPRGAH